MVLPCVCVCFFLFCVLLLFLLLLMMVVVILKEIGGSEQWAGREGFCRPGPSKDKPAPSSRSLAGTLVPLSAAEGRAGALGWGHQEGSPRRSQDPLIAPGREEGGGREGDRDSAGRGSRGEPCAVGRGEARGRGHQARRQASEHERAARPGRAAGHRPPAAATQRATAAVSTG